MNKLKLTKNGFESWSWDGDQKSKHRLKKQDDGSVIVYDRATKEEVARYPSMEVAEDVYWIRNQKENHFWVTELRNSLEIEEGVTVEDFIEAIRQHEELVLTCEQLFGFDWNEFALTEIQGPVEIYRQGSILDGVLTFTCGAIQDLTDPSAPRHLRQSKQMNIHGESVDVTGQYSLSLLEIMQAIFDKCNHPPVHFIFDNNTLSLHYPTGEEVDSPMEAMLSFVDVPNNEFTLNQLFQWVAQHESLCLFIGGYSWCGKIDSFHVEASLPASAADLSDFAQRLLRTVVNRLVSVEKYRRNDEEDISDSMDFISWGKTCESTREHYKARWIISYHSNKCKHAVRTFTTDEAATAYDAEKSFFELGYDGAVIDEIAFQEEKECPEEERCGVGMSPAYHYSHLPFSLDESIEITKSPIFSRKGNKIADGGTIFTGKTRVTLLELLDAVYWEISFYGGPESRDDKFQEISDRADEVKESSDLGEWRVKEFATAEEMLEYEEDDDPEGPYDAYTVNPELDQTTDDLEEE